MKPRRLPQFTKRQWTGFACIYVAGLGWLADVIIPFTNLANKPLLFIIALLFAELMFIVGVSLLGRDLYRRVKTKYLAWLRSGFKGKD
jgi:di/tricarboxylate transporter